MRALAGGLLLLCTSAESFAQEQSPRVAARDSSISSADSTVLTPIVVSVTRARAGSPLEVPFSLTIARPDSERPGQRHNALDETLAQIPGVTAANRNNPSQDPRVSIRGFGSRSAFGVRGIRVLRDGVPLTLPDGQTPVDYLSLESVGQIEVIRGSASALYGNAAGGVIDIRTETPPGAGALGSATQWVAPYNGFRSVAKGAWQNGRQFVQGDAAHARTDGFRHHARQRATTAFLRGGTTLAGSQLTLQLQALHMPVAENPGSVTLAELRGSPRVADPQAVRRNARKEVTQTQAAVTAERFGARGDWSAAAYTGTRELYNPLSFAIVDVHRGSQGMSARVSRIMGRGLSGADRSESVHVTAGVDVQRQNDRRRNFANCADTVRVAQPTATCPDVSTAVGLKTLDQLEIVTGMGAFVSTQLDRGAVGLTAALRADDVRFEVRDRFVSGENPDDSGVRRLRALSPTVGGLLRMPRRRSVYANFSSAFETPTATELGNQPDGSAGLNTQLTPQRARTFEIGSKGILGRAMWYDVAAFATRVRDELIPFEIPGSDGRRYFRNAGRTRRYGGEAAFTAEFGRFRLGGSYSYSDFRFLRYAVAGTSFDGNRIPGIPTHRTQLSATARFAEIVVIAEGELQSGAFADDANTARAPGFESANVRALSRASARLPFLLTAGMNNVFNRRFSPSVSVNAARSRFFEPAPGRAVFAGITFVVAPNENTP